MRHVALLIETTGSYGRGLLAGIAKFNRQQGGWSTYFRPLVIRDSAPHWLKDWKGDGILCRIDTQEMAQLIKRCKLPTVNLRPTIQGLPFPYVGMDNEAIGRTAAEHLLERGLRHFAVCGRPRGINPALDERCDWFEKAVVDAGCDCQRFDAKETSVRQSWEQEQDALVDWVSQLPRPLGVFCCNDERGLQVLDACRRANITVPDDVAVLGVDNDLAMCELSIPPMSSIDINAEGVGYEAAVLLDKMMSGRKPTKMVMRLAPRGVVTRRSTDIVASEDEEVARAAQYIRDHAGTGLQVSDVLSHLGVSRASLQQRMKKVLGRTVHEEIQRVRLAKAKELLATGKLTIKQVSRESGFASVQYMTRVFRAMTGETPARYRVQRAK